MKTFTQHPQNKVKIHHWLLIIGAIAGNFLMLYILYRVYNNV